jgi:hypothetical protein
MSITVWSLGFVCGDQRMTAEATYMVTDTWLRCQTSFAWSPDLRDDYCVAAKYIFDC